MRIIPARIIPATPGDVAEICVLRRCCWVTEAVLNDTRSGYREATVPPGRTGHHIRGAVFLTKPVVDCTL